MSNNEALRPEESLQRSYYAQSASSYDEMHVSATDEHTLALAILAALIRLHNFDSVLDVGSGTGRAPLALASQCPGAYCVGVEPVAELRAVGHAQGLSEQTLIDGRGDNLAFQDNSFDVVCEFAVLHHVPRSRLVINEMSRVARQMLVISDCNFIAQGHPAVRALKRLLFGMKLWPAVTWVKTFGKGYSTSEGDGVFYSYSVFQDVRYLRKLWKHISIIPTRGQSANDGSTLLSADQLMIVCEGKISRSHPPNLI